MVLKVTRLYKSLIPEILCFKLDTKNQSNFLLLEAGINTPVKTGEKNTF